MRYPAERGLRGLRHCRHLTLILARWPVESGCVAHRRALALVLSSGAVIGRSVAHSGGLALVLPGRPIERAGLRLRRNARQQGKPNDD